MKEVSRESLLLEVNGWWTGGGIRLERLYPSFPMKPNVNETGALLADGGLGISVVAGPSPITA